MAENSNKPEPAATPEPAMATAPTEVVANPATTRDATDLGVPMLPGSPNEPQGPEDALGPGPKRGDYRDRIGPAHYHPHQTELGKDGKPVVVAQRPLADNIGDTPAEKGGVTTGTKS